MTFHGGRALVIGISNYREVSSLPVSVLNDARDIASVLRSIDYCGFPSASVRVLLDEEATLEAIRTELAALAGSAAPEDTVLVFFSGHGARLDFAATETSALVPVDCQTSDMHRTTLLESEFSTALAAIRASRLLVMIDACHAGGAGAFKAGEDAGVRFGFDEKSLRRLAQGTGRVMMASSRATETSLVMHGARNSVFTQRLLEALTGKAQTTGDGLVRVFDVFNYVSEWVRATVPGRQHPIFKASDLEDNFPVALDRGGVKMIGANSSKPRHWRKVEEILVDLYPAGPTDQEIWARAGGDVSRLRLSGTGRASWFSALRTLRLGGGGDDISSRTLIEAAIDDFPHHPELASLQGSV